MTSLNTRLMAGLLAVTAVGLLIMGVASVTVMQRYLTNRTDNQLRTVSKPQNLASLRTVERSRPTFFPSRYIIVRVAANGKVSPVIRNPNPTRVEQLVQNMGLKQLQAHNGKTFTLGPYRAIARAGRPRSEVTGQPVTTTYVIAQSLGDDQATVDGLIVTELITGVALLGLLALLARWLIHRGLAPLSRMATTANHIATNESLLRDRMEGGEAPTEVGRLAGAINVMLDRIEFAFVARLRSEAKVREFAADASHELRTPLTTIRGYSELYEQGAVDADEAMRRISGESQRMGRLVEELLELARLDRGSSLTLAPTDLAVLARDAVADAAAVEPDRPLRVEAPESLVTMVDEGRIRQVLANLLANVRQHTPPGTPAVVRLSRTAQWVTLDVSDSGPGMPPEDAARAFDRFHRAEHNPDGGSGLGMAIIAAIAAAHGGRAMLNATSGTTVRIELPVTTSGNTQSIQAPA